MSIISLIWGLWYNRRSWNFVSMSVSKVVKFLIDKKRLRGKSSKISSFFFSNRHQSPLFQTDRLPLWLLPRLRPSLPWTSCWPRTTACPTSPRRPPSLWWPLPLPVATGPFPPVWAARQSSARTPFTQCVPLSERIPVSIRVVSCQQLFFRVIPQFHSEFEIYADLNSQPKESREFRVEMEILVTYISIASLFAKVSILIWTIQDYYIDQ